MNAITGTGHPNGLLILAALLVAAAFYRIGMFVVHRHEARHATHSAPEYATSPYVALPKAQVSASTYQRRAS